MKLPAHLMSQLRLGIAASAVLAGGCDLAGPSEQPPEQPSEPAAAAQAKPAPAASAPSTPRTSDAESKNAPGLAETFARTVERNRPRSLDPLPPVAEDPTAVVPFDAEPGPRVKARAESPLAFAPAPKRKRRKPRKVRDEPCQPEAAPVVKSGGWDDCPGCGRG